MPTWEGSSLGGSPGPASHSGTLLVRPPPQTDQAIGSGRGFCLDPGLKAFAGHLKLNLKFSSSKNALRPMTLCSWGSGQDTDAGTRGQWTVRILGWKQILASPKGRVKPRAGGRGQEAGGARCLSGLLALRYRAASWPGGCHTLGQGRGACFQAEVRFTGTTGGPSWAGAIPGPRPPSFQGPWGAKRLGAREATEPRSLPSAASSAVRPLRT